jgi:hypothetical protein
VPLQELFSVPQRRLDSVPFIQAFAQKFSGVLDMVSEGV